MSSFTILDLPKFRDSRGSLSVIENTLPFNVVRTYWIYAADGQLRGGHRHKYSYQALVAVNGRVAIYMNDGFFQETIELNDPSKCLLVAPKDWHTMKFGAGAVLLVLSSHRYDLTEYIDEEY